MKTKIVPAINSQTFEDIKKKINILKNLTKNFHLDVAEKNFTNYETWQNFNDLDRLEKGVFFDLHLMIFLKPQEILKWAKDSVKKLILHLEATSNPDGLLKFSKKTKKDIFLAWSPNIDFAFIEKYLNFVNGILILGVSPGKAGQDFLENTYKRIEFVKTKLKNNQKLMIDGGINENNFKKILSYDPDFIIMASAIYNSDDPKNSYLKFLNTEK